MNEYPEWIIDKFRNILRDLCTDLEHYIVNAQSIWSTNNKEIVLLKVWRKSDNKRVDDVVTTIKNIDKLYKYIYWGI